MANGSGQSLRCGHCPIENLGETPWTSVHVIVAEFFGYVTFDDLKSCRLVSEVWRIVADKIFYRPKIKVRFPLRLNESSNHDSNGSSMAVKKRNAISDWQEKVESFGKIVTGWGWRTHFPVSHLVIGNENRLASDIYQKTCINLLTQIGQKLHTLEIRFISLNVRKDMGFLQDVLQRAPNLVELCINFNMWRTRGRFGLTRGRLATTRATRDFMRFKHPNLKKLTVNILFSHFSYFRKALEIRQLRGIHLVDIRRHLRRLREMTKLAENTSLIFDPFSNLESLSIKLEGSPYCFGSRILMNIESLPSTIKELHLEPAEYVSAFTIGGLNPLDRLSVWYPEVSVHTFQTEIERHASTLTELELKFLHSYRDIGYRRVARVPPPFSQLVKLTYIMETLKQDNYSPTFDFFYLKDLFTMRPHQFAALFPSLTELRLELGQWKYFDELLPKRRIGNPRNRQILKVRATVEEGVSVENEINLKKRLYSVFPNATQEIVYLRANQAKLRM